MADLASILAYLFRVDILVVYENLDLMISSSEHY